MALRLANGFQKMPDAGLSTRASQILLGMTGNVYFTSPTPSLADFNVVLNTYNTALGNCKEADRVKIAIKNQARETLIQALHSWALYVMLESANDVAKALTSGFHISKTPQPAAPLEKPQAPVLLSGLNTGELIIKGKSMPTAVVYLHQYATEAGKNADQWLGVPSSKSKVVIKGLQPGTLYYCRLVVAGRKSQIVYSDIVSRVAA